MITSRFDSSLPKVERVGNILVHRIGLATRNPDVSDLQRFPLSLNRYLFEIEAALKAHTLHAKHDYGLIWGMLAHTTAIPAGIFKRLHPQVRYLVTLQEGDPLPYIERLMRPVWPLFAQGFKRADALQAISHFLAHWGKRMGFKGEPNVIPNGVDFARFSRVLSDAELQEAQTRLGKKEGVKMLITASRLVHKNAVDDVIRALPLLPEHVVFAVCGIGPDEEMLKALARELKVADRVRWLGEISHRELPALLAVSDCFIRASRSEGMGNAFIEAMAAGLPTIGTNVGGIPDFLTGETGFLVEPDAPDQIAATVRSILERPEDARSIALQGQELARSRYEWNTVTKDMRVLMEKLLV